MQALCQAHGFQPATYYTLAAYERTAVESPDVAWYSPAVPTSPETVRLDEIVRILLEQYGPLEKIILFGSQARGDADEYSDLDLILVKKSTKRFTERLAEVPLLPVHADVFVYTPQEFEQMKEDENPFMMSALESAKTLYERTATDAPHETT